jgi:hypothetical protein
MATSLVTHQRALRRPPWLTAHLPWDSPTALNSPFVGRSRLRSGVELGVKGLLETFPSAGVTLVRTKFQNCCQQRVDNSSASHSSQRTAATGALVSMQGPLQFFPWNFHGPLILSPLVASFGALANIGGLPTGPTTSKHRKNIAKLVMSGAPHRSRGRIADKPRQSLHGAPTLSKPCASGTSRELRHCP